MATDGGIRRTISDLVAQERELREQLAHGEVTVLGVVVGLGACIVSVMLAGGSGGAALPWWAFVVSWAVLAFSGAHFVWPGRGRPRESPAPRDDDQAA